MDIYKIMDGQREADSPLIEARSASEARAIWQWHHGGAAFPWHYTVVKMRVIKALELG